MPTRAPHSAVSHPAHARRASLRLLAPALLVSGLAALAGCGDPPTREARSVEPIVREVPAVLRDTIGAQAALRGTEPILVSGYGVVVGLNGTGGGPLPVSVKANMERDLARGGIGKGGPETGSPLDGLTPSQFLMDPSAAVVVVEGVIAPGAPEGADFDIAVTAVSSGTTSLEGGVLWTTDLRLGPASTVGGVRTRKLAEARGPVFINPFVQPGANPAGSDLDADGRPTGDSVRRTSGRVLAGGRVTETFGLRLVLDNPSHQRANAIQQAINSRFPPGRGDDGPVARGRSSAEVRVHIPRAYVEKPEEFIELLLATRVDLAFPEEAARRYAEAMQAQPVMADQLSWCLRAVGKAAVPFLAPLYDYPEFLPRMAALRAGAGLGDSRAAPVLLEMAAGTGGEPTALRAEAITLLGGMPANPRINSVLRDLLDAQDLEIRIAAYEALRDRSDPFITSFPIAGKFTLDLAPSKDPLIYVTQQGKPRIVVFGDAVRFKRESLASVWSSRLMISTEETAADTSSDPTTMRVFYRDYRSGRLVQTRVRDELKRFVEFAAHQPRPEEPELGLGLSYSEVVGALYELQKSGAIPGSFAAERDRLEARRREAQSFALLEDRPDSEESREAMQQAADRRADAARSGPTPGAPGAGKRPSLVVPLGPPPGSSPGAAAPPRSSGDAGSGDPG